MLNPEHLDSLKSAVEQICMLLGLVGAVGAVAVIALVRAYINGPHADVNAGINTGEY